MLFSFSELDNLVALLDKKLVNASSGKGVTYFSLVKDYLDTYAGDISTKGFYDYVLYRYFMLEN